MLNIADIYQKSFGKRKKSLKDLKKPGDIVSLDDNVR